MSEQANPNSKKKPLKSYAKYSVMAFQMAAIIGGFSYLGVKLDEHFHKSPVFTTAFALFSVFLAIYYSIRDFIKRK